MKKTQIKTELAKHFNYSYKKYRNARTSGDKENEFYWQGRKDMIRILQVSLLDGSEQINSYQLALDNDELFSSEIPK